MDTSLSSLIGFETKKEGNKTNFIIEPTTTEAISYKNTEFDDR